LANLVAHQEISQGVAGNVYWSRKFSSLCAHCTGYTIRRTNMYQSL